MEEHDYTNDIASLNARLTAIEKELGGIFLSDRMFLQTLNFQMLDGLTMYFGSNNGNKIGSSATEKIAFHGASPVVQANAITAANTQSGSYVQGDVQSIATAVNAIITVLKNKGLTA